MKRKENRNRITIIQTRYTFTPQFSMGKSSEPNPEIHSGVDLD